jgi:hypothetical protein
VTIAIVVALVAVVAAVVLGVIAYRERRPPVVHHGVERVLVPFTGGALDPAVLGAGIRIARAEDATLVPAYLIVVPLERAQDAPMQQEVTRAMPLLEAVEHAALRSGVPVDARIESGRTPVHALKRLWESEHFDRIVVPASGFTPKDLTWVLTHAPSETLIFRPAA